METQPLEVIRPHANASKVTKEKVVTVTYIFSFYHNGKKIFDNAEPMEAAEEIIKLFPSQSKEIAKLRSVDFSGTLPKEIDLLGMDPSAQLVLKQAIAKCVFQMEKVSMLV